MEQLVYLGWLEGAPEESVVVRDSSSVDAFMQIYEYFRRQGTNTRWSDIRTIRLREGDPVHDTYVQRTLESQFGA